MCGLDDFHFRVLSLFLTRVFCANTPSYRFGLRSTRQACFDGPRTGQRRELQVCSSSTALTTLYSECTARNGFTWITCHRLCNECVDRQEWLVEKINESNWSNASMKSFCETEYRRRLQKLMYQLWMSCSRRVARYLCWFLKNLNDTQYCLCL